MRMLDLQCSKCGAEVTDFFVRSAVPSHIFHWDCGGEMEQVLRPRPRDAQWSDRDAVVVYRKPNGEYSYPGRNDRPTPPGCTRVVMRSLREVEAFEKRAGVVNEAMHFDHGSGTLRPDDTYRGERL